MWRKEVVSAMRVAVREEKKKTEKLSLLLSPRFKWSAPRESRRERRKTRGTKFLIRRICRLFSFSLFLLILLLSPGAAEEHKEGVELKEKEMGEGTKFPISLSPFPSFFPSFLVGRRRLLSPFFGA